MPQFWKVLIRLTAVFALALFLVPTVYVVKYYAVDRPRETRLMQPVQGAFPLTADFLPLMEQQARRGARADRLAAVHRLGDALRQPYVGVKRPLECLSARATLADLAAHAPDPDVQAAASDELGKVAQGGAVIRR